MSLEFATPQQWCGGFWDVVFVVRTNGTSARALFQRNRLGRRMPLKLRCRESADVPSRKRRHHCYRANLQLSGFFDIGNRRHCYPGFLHQQSFGFASPQQWGGQNQGFEKRYPLSEPWSLLGFGAKNREPKTGSSTKLKWSAGTQKARRIGL